MAQHAQAIAKAFKNFDLDALARTDSIDLAVVPIKNERKVKGFLKGAKAIASEGFKAFKVRLKEGGMERSRRTALDGAGQSAAPSHDIRPSGHCEGSTFGLGVAQRNASFPASAPSFPSSPASMACRNGEVDAFLWDYCRRHQDIPPTD